MTEENNSLHELKDTDFNAYEDTMDRSEKVTDSTEEQMEEKAAGFWYRLIAYIIDVIIVGSINGVLLTPLIFINNGVPIEISFWTLNGILSLVIYYAYFFLMTKFFQQTLGKMIVGIKVISVKEDTISWSDIFYREVVGRIFYNAFMMLKLLYLIVAFTKNKQGLHDMIGRTRVIFI